MAQRRIFHTSTTALPDGRVMVNCRIADGDDIIGKVAVTVASMADALTLLMEVGEQLDGHPKYVSNG